MFWDWGAAISVYRSAAIRRELVLRQGGGCRKSLISNPACASIHARGTGIRGCGLANSYSAGCSSNTQIASRLRYFSA